ncbi:MAG: glycoside hydrolase family 43 protein [Ignavibacteriae bacterium]|nr:glycoside hydrolase family 43 protein [Ignavibacteriota bacterium]
MNNACRLVLGFVLAISLIVNIASSQQSGFANPILAGFYPDPSICKVGSDYYLTNSTFSYFPGLPIFHSKDLVHWKLIGHVMDREVQLNLDKQGVSRGLYAPSIRYHDGLFYVTCTLVDIGGNFVVTASNPAGPWSNPVWLPEINGVDPSMFFDEDGQAYIIYNSIAPEDKPLYNGHRTIRMYEFDVESLKVKGKEILLVNGGVDLSKKPIWIEGPHIFKRNDYYYLFCAEGGTGDQHSEVVFRSKNVDGPYVPYKNNPILTQRHLNQKSENPITSTGHADFVETDTGEWWAVFLGCRPYPPVDQDYYNTGRETFLAPVKWSDDDWPVINPGHEQVQYHYPYPIQPLSPTGYTYGGNFTMRDDFSTDTLDANWIFLRTPHEKWYDLTSKKGWLAMRLRPDSASGNTNPSFLGHRQQHLIGSTTVALDFSAAAENEKAGLLIFQNEKHFYSLCKSVVGMNSYVQLFKSGESAMEMLASHEIDAGKAHDPLLLRINANADTYAFSYAFEGKWTTLKDSVDAKFLSTKVAGGFVGCVYAMYATSSGEPSTNTARFDWFEYVGDDEVYR